MFFRQNVGSKMLDNGQKKSWRPLHTEDNYKNKIQYIILQLDLYYPRFLRPNLSTPNLYEIQSDLHYLHLYYPQFLRPKFSTPNYRDNRGLTVYE